jgi:hypothetical protein
MPLCTIVVKSAFGGESCRRRVATVFISCRVFPKFEELHSIWLQLSLYNAGCFTDRQPGHPSGQPCWKAGQAKRLRNRERINVVFPNFWRPSSGGRRHMPGPARINSSPQARLPLWAVPFATSGGAFPRVLFDCAGHADSARMTNT